MVSSRVSTRQGAPPQRVVHWDHNHENIETCAAILVKLDVELVVMEATGGYETNLVVALQTARHPRGGGQPATGPRLSPGPPVSWPRPTKSMHNVLARFAAVMQPPAQEQLDRLPIARILQALVARRKQLVDMQTMEKNRKDHIADKIIARSIDELSFGTIEKGNRQGRKADQPAHRPAAGTERKGPKLLKTVPGIGDTTAAMLVVEVPEIGRAQQEGDCRPDRRGCR